nr:TylF/MycF/NovP-related O-methyltransferase [Echinimonas agarilytica]
MTDPEFVKVIQDNNPEDLELSFLWRTHTLAWAARHAAQLEGDFVECGCYRGYTAKVVADLVGFSDMNRQYWLYDVFNPETIMGSHNASISDPFEFVKKRFEAYNNVNVIKGYVPSSFEQGMPEKVALLHIDMNHAEAELGALEHLFERVVSGGVIVLDDYGWTAYKAQTVVEDGWLNAKGYFVLELPTGQGVVIKR